MPAKLREHRYVILAAILVTGAAFYWFQVRPSMIRHSCSWVLHHTDAVPAKPAQGTPLTQAQVTANKKYMAMSPAQRAWAQVTQPTPAAPVGQGDGVFHFLGDPVPDTYIPYTDTYVPAVPAQPATNWWGQASDEQYRFCVQDKGL